MNNSLQNPSGDVGAYYSGFETVEHRQRRALADESSESIALVAGVTVGRREIGEERARLFQPTGPNAVPLSNAVSVVDGLRQSQPSPPGSQSHHPAPEHVRDLATVDNDR